MRKDNNSVWMQRPQPLVYSLSPQTPHPPHCYWRAQGSRCEACSSAQVATSSARYHLLVIRNDGGTGRTTYGPPKSSTWRQDAHCALSYRNASFFRSCGPLDVMSQDDSPRLGNPWACLLATSCTCFSTLTGRCLGMRRLVNKRRPGINAAFLQTGRWRHSQYDACNVRFPGHGSYS